MGFECRADSKPPPEHSGPQSFTPLIPDSSPTLAGPGVASGNGELIKECTGFSRVQGHERGCPA